MSGAQKSEAVQHPTIDGCRTGRRNERKRQQIKSQAARHAIMATFLGLLAMFIAATTT
jgi:hypothetical protein